MADYSLTDIANVINQQIENQELVNEYFAKIQAMVCVTSCEDFFEYDHSIIHSYLWALGDLVADAKKISEETLSILLKNTRILGYR